MNAENPAAANVDVRLALEESLPSVAKSRGSARATASEAAFHRSSPIHNGSTGLCFLWWGILAPQYACKATDRKVMQP
jgi:hypothetical protein